MNAQQQSNIRSVRGNGNFRIATSEIKMSESPEKHQPAGPSSSSSSRCDFRGKAKFNAPMRPILHHTPCNNVERDNNTSDDSDGGDDDNAIFYKRDEIEDDGENNREFDSPKDDSRDDDNSSTFFSTALWPSPSLDCSSPQLISRPHHLSSSLRAFSDLRLESVEGLLVVQNQQQDWEKEPEDDPHELLANTAAEQPQQGDDEEKDPRGDDDKSNSSSSEIRDSNQLSVEPIEATTTEYSAKCYEGESPLLLRRRRRSSGIYCEPMVHYELFDSVQKSQQQLVTRSSESNFFSFASNRNHGDDDVMNIRSPVNQRPTTSSSSSSSSTADQQQQQEHLTESRQGWTPQQLSQYNDVLTFLQGACATRSPQISIPGAQLAQMEQLLRSLHPKT